jgi:CRISPR-associated protein Cmr4
LEAVFGPDAVNAASKAHAGAFSPGDARILLFPVRSLKGVFAWVTSVNVLQRWAKSLLEIGDEYQLPVISAPSSTQTEEFCYASSNQVVTSMNKVVLEEYVFTRQENAQIVELATKLAERVFPTSMANYWKELLKTNLVILPDDAFKDFVSYATEVITRTRLEPDSKTVVRHALWTEEHLPVDTVLYSPIRATRIRMNQVDIPVAFAGTPEEQAEKTLTWLSGKLGERIQLGGDETIGRGLVNLNWAG